jgi:hypothetical protein
MAENNEHKNEEHFSKVVRAGKRTYFFDVKSTRKGEHYLTITESKRKFNNEQGKFFYEKFKIFLYKEDFEKFTDAMEETLKHIVAHNEKLSDNLDENESVPETKQETDGESDLEDDSLNTSAHTDLDFEDLGKESEKVQQNDTNY